MMTNSTEARYGWGMAATSLLGIFTIANKGIYLWRAKATAGEFMLGMLPALLLALCCLCTYLVIGNWRGTWSKRIGQSVVTAVTALIAVFTMVAAIGYWQTGSIPRLQQFHGLTWDILAPSVIEILHKNLPALIATLVSILLLLWLLKFTVARVRWRKLLPYGFSAVAVLVLVLTVTAIFGSVGGAKKYTEVIAAQFFRTDLDMDAATSQEAKQAEVKFFNAYYEQLGQATGPRYEDIFDKLKGSNVIYLVLESTRAKDVPLYGGSADMPNLMQARQHMILLKNLYAQDPRSTKAYPQLDMGRFSLLSWSSYSNNVPWMFPEDGLANHLTKLGYEAYSLVNGDRFYDHHMIFQEHHGYQHVLYRQGLNPGSPDADDMKLLSRVKQELAQADKPFYMMIWPIETHHPYGREFWAHKNDWVNSHPESIQHKGAADHERYLNALHEVDDWFGRLIQVLKEEGKYENTVIVVTGDHGEAFGEHESGNVFHGNGVYQESVHVTGFIYSPKIEGLHVDERYLRLLDIPASILNIASSGDYLFNDGRSIFKEYKHAMPIYLFNSWAGAVGIIYEGKKLWHRDRPGSPIYYASLAEIHQDPAKERQLAKDGQGQALLDMMNEWRVAMGARTARLLSVEDSDQPGLNDMVRIYCDDGNGFREGLKYSSEFAGLSGAITIQVDHACRALRIAPIKDTKIPKGSTLDIDISAIEVDGDQRVWTASDMKLDGMSGLNFIDGTHFSATQDSAFLDYSVATEPVRIKAVTMKISFVWRKLKSP